VSATQRRVLQALLGTAVSVGCGWLAVRNTDWGEVRQALTHARYLWLVPALASLGVGVWLRSERWRHLFVPSERPRPAPVFWAMNIGYLFNNILPARAGEVARVLALSRETGLARTHGLVTVVVERVFDLASLAILVLALLFYLPSGHLARDLVIASAVILALSVLLVGVLALAPVRRRAVQVLHRLPFLGSERALRTARSVALGLGSLRQARLALPVAVLSMASWLVLALSNWCVLQAFSIDAPWHAAVFVLVATNLAMALPSGAGAIGVFEWAAQAALVAYGVPKELALSAALVIHVVNIVPFFVLGTIGIMRMGASRHGLLAAAGDGPVP
jgi:glycosyltransferase 2 family protein